MLIPRTGSRVRAVAAACCALIAAGVLFGALTPTGKPATTPADVQARLRADTAPARILDAFDSLPLRFDDNRGQLDPNVKFVARGRGYALFLTPEGATLALHREVNRSRGSLLTAPGERRRPISVEEAVLRMKIVGARTVTEPQGLGEQPGRVRYVLGSDSGQSQSNVSSYARVRYPEVLPGIDLVYYGTGQHQLEYDLVASPGADPGGIAVAFEGADQLQIDEGGGLVLRVGDAEIRQQPPVAYQDRQGGQRDLVAARYVRRSNGDIGFDVGGYDRSRALIIDPVLVYSTYLGGGDADFGTGIAYSAGGYAYIVGQTLSTNYPTTPGAFQPVNAFDDAFVTKLSSDGSELVFSTYLGGSGSDYAWRVALDHFGDVYVVGNTSSTDFPTTPGAFHTSSAGAGDVFVTKLDRNGSVLYSTLVGGAGQDEAWGIAIEANGSAYIAGNTDSLNYPTTPGAFQTTRPSSEGLAAFVTKLAPSGAGLVYSTYLVGPVASGFSLSGAYDVVIDGSGSAYVTGYTNSTTFPTTPGAFHEMYGGGALDGFLTKVTPTGSALVFSTYLGGSGGEYGRALAFDADGSAYVTGVTNSTDFVMAPGDGASTNAGGVDVFVGKFDPTGGDFYYGKFLGGSFDDNVADMAIDSARRVTIVGNTHSPDYPTTPDAVQGFKTLSSDNDIFVTTLTPNGDIAYSTFLGGPHEDFGYGVAVDGLGRLYVTGASASINYPTTPGAFQTSTASPSNYDTVVTKLAVSPPLVPATNLPAVAMLALLLALTGGCLARSRRSA